MRLSSSLGLPLLAAGSALAAYVPEGFESQHNFNFDTERTLELTRPVRAWNEPVTQDATGNVIFQSLYSLMQMMPNSRYPNGHTIVRANIPTGTLLYHGRSSDVAPAHEQDWIAVDPEHSFMFARGDNGHLFTFVTTRPLNLIYFDGASGNKNGGVIDTQDLLIWGDIDHQHSNSGRGGEGVRLADACEWGKPYGIDGFVRMEMDFEIMYCDFTEGLKVVSTVNILHSGRGGGGQGGPGRGRQPTDDAPDDGPDGPGGPGRGRQPTDGAPEDGPGGPTPPEADAGGPRGGPGGPGGGGPGRGDSSTPPAGWKGSLPGGGWEGAAHTGAWHNYFPGDLRVRVEPSTMVTLFDPSFTSLIPSRRSLPRDQWRLLNMSQADIAQARADLAEAMGRPRGADSGVDWLGLAQTITQRFEDRLPFLRFLLHQPYANASAQAAAVRQHLSVPLLPYIPRVDIGTQEWFAAIAGNCAASFASHLPEERLTKQERVLRDAFEEVLHEICRVLGGAWEEAFDVEEQSVAVAEARLTRWRESIDGLIQWLDWPVWNVCQPACSIDEVCYLPQSGGPMGRSSGKQQETPHCVSLLSGNVAN